jgi:hypothetical protein
MHVYTLSFMLYLAFIKLDIKKTYPLEVLEGDVILLIYYSSVIALREPQCDNLESH